MAAPQEPKYPSLETRAVPVEPASGEWSEALRKLLAHPDLASKSFVYSQYDHMVRTDTLMRPGGDAALVRVKGTGKALALTVDGNARYCALNPRAGGQIAVVEAARNLSCVGAEPIGLTDCLNFGNPERPEVMWAFSEVVEGMAEACRRLDIPVVSGNVSFYNETRGEGIHPTPTVGMVGLLERAETGCPAAFQRAGDLIVLLGSPGGTPEGAGLGGSLYLWSILGLRRGPCPGVDLEHEVALQAFCRRAIAEGLLSSCHDVSDGGLAVALAECGLLAEPHLGLSVTLPWEGSAADVLFGEGQGRVIASIRRENLALVETLTQETEVPLLVLGEVVRDRVVLRVSDWLSPAQVVMDVPVQDVWDAWRFGLERGLGTA